MTRKTSLVAVVGNITASKFSESIFSISSTAVEDVIVVGTFDGAPNATIGIGLAVGEVPTGYLDAWTTLPIGLMWAGYWAVEAVIVGSKWSYSESGGKVLPAAPEDVDSEVVT